MKRRSQSAGQTFCKSAHLGTRERNATTSKNAQQEQENSTVSLKSVLDMSHTLSQIMILCGIDESKAKASVDIIAYCFLHCDLVCYCLDTKPTKRLRKEDIFHELGGRCEMNRPEAHLCYNIIKWGFKAFNFVPQHEEETEESAYVIAAKKTAEYYGKFEGLSSKELRQVEAKINMIYKKYFDRLQMRKDHSLEQNCTCCYCTSYKDNYVSSKPPPKAETQATFTCSCSCKEKKKRKRKRCHCAAPQYTIPQSSIPQCTVPQYSYPQYTVPCYTVPQYTIPQCTIPQYCVPQWNLPQCSLCRCARQYCCCSRYFRNTNCMGNSWSRPKYNLYYEKPRSHTNMFIPLVFNCPKTTKSCDDFSSVHIQALIMFKVLLVSLVLIIIIGSIVLYLTNSL